MQNPDCTAFACWWSHSKPLLSNNGTADWLAPLWQILYVEGVLISGSAAAVINDSANELYVSDVSLWEITLKHSTGKLPLPDVPRIWIPEKFAYHKFNSLSLSQAAIYRSGELPRMHLDPFDRLLTAQAMEAGMTLLSPDTPLSLLGASRLW